MISEKYFLVLTHHETDLPLMLPPIALARHTSTPDPEMT